LKTDIVVQSFLFILWDEGNSCEPRAFQVVIFVGGSEDIMADQISYEFRVKGILEARWSSWFTPLEINAQADETLIAGPIRDQSELFGTLLKIRDMGLQLISAAPARPPVFSSPFPQLITERLLLREFTLSDVSAVFDILRRPEVNQWLETDPLQSLEAAQARLRSRMGLFRDGMGFRWAITLRQQPEQVIGSCGFFSVRRGTQTVECGYELHPDHWGKGIMSEALQAMSAFSFDPHNPLPVHRIEALVAPGNAASIRLLEKLAFTCEGRRRQFGFWKGSYQDVLLYAFLGKN
jgi:ribosomal-protein-alanine N-acetyltransferase